MSGAQSRIVEKPDDENKPNERKICRIMVSLNIAMSSVPCFMYCSELAA